MLDCCESFYLGKFAHNEEKEFEDLVADIAGDYTFELYFLGVVRKLTANFSVDDILLLPDWFGLNEDAMYMMNIKNPNGDYVTFAYQQCFTFKTVISLTDCEPCNTDIYGMDESTSIDNNPYFELGEFE